jgi:uncharacterized membrane protein
MATQNVEQPATAKRLYHLASSGFINEAGLKRALQLAGYWPDGQAWQQFLNTSLLVLAAAFTISGIFFFFAFNWAAMPPFLKFGLIEGAIVVAAGLAYYFGLTRLTGKIALTTAALLVGALLAVFGQVYQTGADTYTLFLFWSLLIAGWVVISAFSPLWFGLLLLLNITVITYWGQVVGGNEVDLSLMLSLLNGAALIGWEVAHRQGIAWLGHRWLPRLIALAMVVSLLIPTLEFIFSFDQAFQPPRLFLAGPLFYTLFTASVLVYYTRITHDLLTLTLAALSLIVVITSLIGKMLDFEGDSAAVMLIMSLIIIGQAGLAVHWLLKISARWEDHHV